MNDGQYWNKCYREGTKCFLDTPSCKGPVGFYKFIPGRHHTLHAHLCKEHATEMFRMNRIKDETHWTCRNADCLILNPGHTDYGTCAICKGDNDSKKRSYS